MRDEEYLRMRAKLENDNRVFQSDTKLTMILLGGLLIFILGLVIFGGVIK